MVKIRLARIGKRKKPMYRIVVSDSQKDTFGRFLEILGQYNPFTKVCEVKKDRVLYWVGKGAQLSPTLHNLMVDQNVITGEKVRAYRPKKETGEGAVAEAKPAEKKETKEEKPVEPKVEKPKEEAKPVEKKEEPKAEEKPVEKSAEGGSQPKADAPLAHTSGGKE